MSRGSPVCPSRAGSLWGCWGWTQACSDTGSAGARLPLHARRAGASPVNLHKVGGLRGRWLWIQACRGAPARPRAGFLPLHGAAYPVTAGRSPGGVRTLALGGVSCAGPPGLARRRAGVADS